MRQVLSLIPVVLILLARTAGAADVVYDSDEGTTAYRIPLDIGTAGLQEALDIEAGLHRTLVHHPPSQTTAEIIQTYWQPLAADGYREIFRCHDRTCGGIDFRRSIEVAPFPGMYVNLGDYQYLVAVNGQDSHVVLLASRSNSTGFLQIDRLGTTPTDPAPRIASSPAAPRIPPFRDRLAQDGHAVLQGLEFASGSDTLVDGNYPDLAELALWMQDNPEATIVLVGHTDNAGSLEQNQQLSVLRARAVLNRMITAHGIDGNRVTVHGIGFLAPLTTNTTEEGRAINRRVEVVPIKTP